MRKILIRRGALFKTGTPNPISGHFKFACYLDGTVDPPPTDGEAQIPLTYRKVFPPINSARKGCWWQLVRKL
jgi:hypothetical protein